MTAAVGIRSPLFLPFGDFQKQPQAASKIRAWGPAWEREEEGRRFEPLKIEAGDI